jgi:hypothetical protein
MSMTKKTGDLVELVKASAATWRAALDEIKTATGQDDDGHLSQMLAQWRRDSEWLEKRVESLVNPPTAGTKEGIERRQTALKAAEESGDEKEAQRLRDQLAALGVTSSK